MCILEILALTLSNLTIQVVCLDSSVSNLCKMMKTAKFGVLKWNVCY